MKKLQSVLLHVAKAGMLAVLLTGGSLVLAQDSSVKQEGSLGPSDRGYTPGTSFNAVAGVEIQPRNLALSFNLPLVPSFSVGGGMAYEVTARYNGNFTSGGGGVMPPYIPSARSPFGISFESGFGVLTQSYHAGLREFPPDGVGEDYRRSWTYISPDGSAHTLHVIGGGSSTPPLDIVNHVGAGTFLVQQPNNSYKELYNSGFEYMTGDGSLIRAKVSVDAGGNPTGFDLWFPDGRHAIFAHRVTTPVGSRTLQDVANNGVCPQTTSSSDPEEMYGFYPTRIENRLADPADPQKGAHFDLTYSSTYPWLVEHITDNSSRVNGSVDFTITNGLYTAISYPAAGGNRLTLRLDYIQRTLNLFNSDNGQLSGIAQSVNLLRQVTYPGGYAQRFEYYEDNSKLENGHVHKIFLPAGGVHEFTYAPVNLTQGVFSGTTSLHFEMGVIRHDLYTREGLSSADTSTDHLQWQYYSIPLLTCFQPHGSPYPYQRTIITDPAGTSTLHFFDNLKPSASVGLLLWTEYYQGNYAATDTCQYASPTPLKKLVLNTWAQFGVLPLPERQKQMKTVRTATRLYDDKDSAGNPLVSTLIEENSDWDGWGNFKTKLTHGTLIPKPKKTVTAYSITNDPGILSYPTQPLFGSQVGGAGWAAHCSALDLGLSGNVGPGGNYAKPLFSNCPYFSNLLDLSQNHWFPTLPLRSEIYEQDALGAWVLKGSSETRYDVNTGLPVRIIARANPATVTSSCNADLVPAAGDIVTDLFYDDLGDLALKKTYGADDTSVYRSYSGVGDPPAASDSPLASPTVFPAGSNEKIYARIGADYGYGRWSRAYTGESAGHQFLNGRIESADIDPASGAVNRSFDANGLVTIHAYDPIGRISDNQFIGDGTQPSELRDKPVHFDYLDRTIVNGFTDVFEHNVKQPVGIQTIQEDSNNPGQRVETQDYYDGLGRKVITRRRNPDGQFAYQVMHYDRMGNADLVSNWSFNQPMGLADPALPDPSPWTESYLAGYITNTVGAYTKNCYRVGCLASNKYDYAGRVQRAERIGQGGTLISAVDTEYFGLNVKTTVHGIKTGASSTADAVTVHYKDGYGNLRVVDVDAGGAGGGQGTDAIYDYDYANHLVKVNLVPQVSAIGNSTDRYATTDGDVQPRFFTFDTLGRLTMAQNQENGITKYLKFNALGQILEAEDENGRIGGGPGGGAYLETEPSAPGGACICSQFEPPNGCVGEYVCPAPILQDNNHYATATEFNMQWTATGKQKSGGITSTVPADQLYYRIFLDNMTTPVVNWTEGKRSYEATGLSAGGHTLKVETTYGANAVAAPDMTRVAALSVPFTAAANALAYHLVHLYDGRGRELQVQKKLLSNNSVSTLRAFSYEQLTGDCTVAKKCGRLTSTSSYQGGNALVSQTFNYDNPNGRLFKQSNNVPGLGGAAKSYETTFDYDLFGRQRQAWYPTEPGPSSPDAVLLDFQYGGVKSVNKFASGVLTPYATIAHTGDYLPDGSLARFLQGNNVEFKRAIDDAERVSDITYLGGCLRDFGSSKSGPPCSGPQLTLWDSGQFLYDQAGNIVNIGDDAYTYDRMSRLKTTLQNRHPHLASDGQLQPAGSVSLGYDYDIYGNITRRQQTAATNYTAFTDASLEQFGVTTPRDYTNGTIAPDNKIHTVGFLYDSNGNLVSDGKKDFIYDELNQQVEVREAITSCSSSLAEGVTPHANKAQIQHAAPQSGIQPANVSCYGLGNLIESNIYGPDGMRAARSTYPIVNNSSTEKRTLYTRLGGNVITEFSYEYEAGVAKPSHSKNYIYGPLGLLATEEYCKFNCDATKGERAGPSTHYYEYDHLGTIRAITNSAGQLESTFDYEPFGLELKPGAGFPTWYGDTSSNTHRFTGHERDEEAGEDYMKARMYVLSTARFPQIDPAFDGAGDPQNWNAYIYVHNSPVGASDPKGMSWLKDKAPSSFAHGGGLGLAIVSAYNSVVATGKKVVEAVKPTLQAGAGLVAGPVIAGAQGVANSTKQTLNDLKHYGPLGPTVTAGRAVGGLAAAANHAHEVLTNPGEAALAGIEAQNAFDQWSNKTPYEAAKPVGVVIAAGATAVAPFASGLGLGSASETLTAAMPAATPGEVAITHFTDEVGINSISKSGSLNADTFVTRPGEISNGATSGQIEQALEINAGKGQYSVTVTTPQTNLRAPANGEVTSGGKWQRQLNEPVAVSPDSIKKTP